MKKKSKKQRLRKHKKFSKKRRLRGGKIDGKKISAAVLTGLAVASLAGGLAYQTTRAPSGRKWGTPIQSTPTPKKSKQRFSL